MTEQPALLLTSDQNIRSVERAYAALQAHGREMDFDNTIPPYDRLVALLRDLQHWAHITDLHFDYAYQHARQLHLWDVDRPR